MAPFRSQVRPEEVLKMHLQFSFKYPKYSENSAQILADSRMLMSSNLVVIIIPGGILGI